MEKQFLTADILVVGAGIAGLTAALEAAETGYSVVLIDKNPYVGGRVAQLNQYFPKLCPPSCGLELNTRRLRDSKNINLLTMTDILSIDTHKENFEVHMSKRPTYVNNDYPDLEKVAKEIHYKCNNEFNFSLNKINALCLPYNNCFPNHYIFHKEACSNIELDYLASDYPDVFDFKAKHQHFEYQFTSIIWATGWKPYNAKKLDLLGYNTFPNVITNIELERLTAPNGPLNGNLQLMADEMPINKVVFVQCAGSRDENHLEFCSSVCCMASLKQARYIREQFPEAEVHIFYIDLRAQGILEDFYRESQSDEKLFFHRGKVAKVTRGGHDNELIVEAEDTMAGQLNQMSAELVILATGMQADSEAVKKLVPEIVDPNGFVLKDLKKGMHACGTCTRPKDVAASVQEATGAAMQAIINIKEHK